MKWKCILFDLDGTLADTSEGVIHAIEYTIKECGYSELPTETMRSFIGPPIFESLKKEYKLSDDEARTATEIFRCAYKDKFLLEAKVYDGIVPLLSLLKSNSIRLAVATNKRMDYATKLLQHLELSQFFDHIQGSDYENKMKKTEVIQACIDRMNLSNSDVVLIGDTIYDFYGAKKCFVDFLAVDYGFGIKTSEEKESLSGIPIFSNLDSLTKYLIIQEDICG